MAEDFIRQFIYVTIILATYNFLNFIATKITNKLFGRLTENERLAKIRHLLFDIDVKGDEKEQQEILEKIYRLAIKKESE